MGQYFLKKLANDKKKKNNLSTKRTFFNPSRDNQISLDRISKRNVESCLLIVRSYVSPIEPTKLRSVVLLLVEGIRMRAREKEISRNFSLTFRHPRNSKRTTAVNDIRNFRVCFLKRIHFQIPIIDFILSFLFFFTSVFRVTLESDLYKIA